MPAQVQQQQGIPWPSSTTGDDGITTVTSFYINADGQKVKVTQKIRKRDALPEINTLIESRKKWQKYGLEAGAAPGPSKNTTDVEDDVQLRLFPKSTRPDKDQEEEKPLKKSAVIGGVRCRNCGGPHFTHLCPYKDRLGGLQDEPPLEPTAAPVGPGKYQPPTIPGKPGFLGRMEERDDSATLRVSNLPENVDEKMLRDAFSRPGRLTRSHIARDKNTGQGRGFAFFSYETKSDAEAAQRLLNGKAIGHLVMSVEFSKK